MRRALAVGALACVGAGASSSAPQRVPAAAADTGPAIPPAAAPVVVYDRAKAPAACAPQAIARKIDAMFAVMDSGRVEDLTALLDPEPQFAWYSMTAGVRLERLWHVVGRTPASVRALFARRRAVSEHARLAALTVRFDPDTGLANLEPTYRYQADDLAQGRPRYGSGKASFSCREGRLRVWSGAVDARATSPRRSTYCGATAGRLRLRAEAHLGPLVCAERST